MRAEEREGMKALLNRKRKERDTFMAVRELVNLEQHSAIPFSRQKNWRKSGGKKWKKNWQISTEDGRTTDISRVSASPSADTESLCAKKGIKQGHTMKKSMKNFLHSLLALSAEFSYL